MTLQKLYPARVSIYLELQVMQTMPRTTRGLNATPLWTLPNYYSKQFGQLWRYGMSPLISKIMTLRHFLRKKGNSRYLRQKREPFDGAVTEEGHIELRLAVKGDFHSDVQTVQRHHSL